jgi:hypothetical protein
MKDLLAIVFVAGILGGFFMNCFRAVDCDYKAPYKCEAVRIVGIFVPPVGAVVGWMDLGE